jgi:hypothetical protein
MPRFDFNIVAVKRIEQLYEEESRKSVGIAGKF